MRKILCLCFCIISISAKAQGKADSIPLLKFLQENFDSSVVWNCTNAWNAEPYYRIVVKRANKKSLLKYANPLGRFISTPSKELTDKFISRSISYRFTKPDTNIYLIPFYDYKNPKAVDTLWHEINQNNIWNLRDDKIEGEGCPPNGASISDSDENTFFLITRMGIKQLYFYDPEFSETHCPGRVSRQKILQIMKEFMRCFK